MSVANDSEPERAPLFLSTLTARGLKRSVHVRGFLLAHCRGLSPSQHALLVPMGRQPRLRTVIRYHSPRPPLALVDPDTTACPSGC